MRPFKFYNDYLQWVYQFGKLVTPLTNDEFNELIRLRNNLQDRNG